MLFNSLEYLIFLPLVFLLFWNLKHQYRWLLLLISSCIFYMYFIPYYILILLLTILVDYFAGILIYQTTKQHLKKVYLYSSIIVTCLILFFFKYFNFFDQIVYDVSQTFNLNYSKTLLNIALPIGLSFHTFQSLSYVIEVYRGNQRPETHFGIYSLYVLFFPQLVAGPIERPQNLLHQFHEVKEFNRPMVIDGLRQILWGLFKKVVVADNLAHYSDNIFNNYNNYPASSLLVGAIYFSIQIYCDFSGYSEMAIGSAKLFGFNLMKNFNFPYFSRDMAEFWRNWHISLSTWFRDYVYYPLGGSKVTRLKAVRNTMIIFLLSGFWHGANWTFVIWGAINALYFLPLLLLNKNRKNIGIVAENKLVPSLKEFFQMGLTFLLATIAWIFFRSNTLHDASQFLINLASSSITSRPVSAGIVKCLPIIIFMFTIEWIQRNKKYTLEINSIKSKGIRWSIYYLIILTILLIGGTQQSFIYFQF